LGGIAQGLPRVSRDCAHDTAALTFVVADDKASGQFLDDQGGGKRRGGIAIYLDTMRPTHHSHNATKSPLRTALR
jgi:hypothetical protein